MNMMGVVQTGTNKVYKQIQNSPSGKSNDKSIDQDQRLNSVDRQLNEPGNKKNNDDGKEKSPNHWVDVASNWREIQNSASANFTKKENVSFMTGVGGCRKLDNI